MSTAARTRCDFCGGDPAADCASTEGSVIAHAEWFLPFASRGEEACGVPGFPPHLTWYRDRPRPCLLPAGHGGHRHRHPVGWSWPVRTTVTEEAS